MRGNRTPLSLFRERKRYHCSTRNDRWKNFLTNFSLTVYLANEFSKTDARFKWKCVNAALLGYNPNMRYHPRIQAAALKVGFHALLLHKYSKRLQTYSQSSRSLLLKMLDGKFFNWLLFNSLSKISKSIFNCIVYDNKVQRIRVLPLKKLLFLFSCSDRKA